MGAVQGVERAFVRKRFGMLHSQPQIGQNIPGGRGQIVPFGATDYRRKRFLWRAFGAPKPFVGVQFKGYCFCCHACIMHELRGAVKIRECSGFVLAGSHSCEMWGVG